MAQIDRNNDTLTVVAGIEVGHCSDPIALTGCTVLLCRQGGGAVGAVELVGGATGTRNLDPLLPGHGSDRIHGICLAGGSNFGLGAVDGVLTYLRDQGVGVEFGGLFIPLVPGAILFDLPIGEPVPPTPQMGLAAAQQASDGPVEQGAVGAGTGATVGNLGKHMPGGLGSSGTLLDPELAVGALVAVNCMGDVTDPETGQRVAGARTEDGAGWLDSDAHLLRTGLVPVGGWNTTLAVVATNAALSREELGLVARMAAGALHRCIAPAATNVDGDVVFALSTGVDAPPAGEPDLHRIGVAARRQLERAIVRAVTSS
jgi:L-aminopeptidase/D-esterase-like protein